jgi:hypothetical protein
LVNGNNISILVDKEEKSKQKREPTSFLSTLYFLSPKREQLHLVIICSKSYLSWNRLTLGAADAAAPG